MLRADLAGAARRVGADLRRLSLGARPAVPGWKTATISPRIGDLGFAKGKVPTPRGPIHIDWRNGNGFALDLTLPEGMGAMVDVPAAEGSKEVWVNGVKADAAIKDGRWFLMNEVSGKLRIEVK